MVIFNFNPTSFLNTAGARVVNSAILVFWGLIFTCSTFHNLDIEGVYIFLLVFWWLLLVDFSTDYVLKKNKWFELDKKEARNKKSFTILYCLLSSLFVALIEIYLLSAIMIWEQGGFRFWLDILLVIYFIFNWVNICSLFNFDNSIDKLFSQYIDTSKLPTKEALKKDKEILKYVLEREYRIDLEKIMDSAYEDGWKNFLNRGW